MVIASEKTLLLVFLVFSSHRQRIDKGLGQGATINMNFWFIGHLSVIDLWMVLGTILETTKGMR